MNTQQFLKQVLGDSGHYCIVGLKKDAEAPPVQKFFDNLDSALAVANNLKDEGYNAYYALATFEDGKSRKATNVKQLRSLFIDLDCGPNKPYATQAEALVELKRFCGSVGLPKPTLVNSGGGIHAYWCITEPITKDMWIPVAEKLKSLCDDYDLYADPVVTADSVRILRVPGTLNFKGDEAREVGILNEIQAPVTFEFLKQVIGEVINKPRSYIPRGEMDEVTKAILGNYTNRFKTILMKTNKGVGCQQIKYLIENQDTLDEPMWRAGLSIAKFCIDADKAIHKISMGHPGYSPEETEGKTDRIKGGPYTCIKFEEYNPGGCDGCVNKGTIKSPIVLGREVQEANDEDNIVEDVLYDVEQGHTQTYVIPKYPEPYFRGKNGGIYKRIVKEDDEIEVLVYHNDLYVTRRLDDTDIGEAIVIRLHLPKDGVREFTIPLSAVGAKDEFRKLLATKGVAMIKMDEIMTYVNNWVNNLQMQKAADKARRQFGWTDDVKFDAFVVGDKEIRADRVDHNPPSNSTKQLMSAFESKGTIEKWKEAMEFYNRPGMELHQFVIGLSFGSMFTAFTPINAALLHIFSPESGIGKTTAMIAGSSVWGDPARLLLKESDTGNSKMNRAEIYKNLPLWMDEVTNSPAKDLSDFLYQYTSGSQRNRLTSSANQERVRGEIWKQNGISTGNTSMIERMSAYKSVPKAEAMRVLEVRAYPVTALNKAETDILSETLSNNYGHAYLPYLQYVMNDIAGTKELYKVTQAKIDQAAQFGPADRFHSVLAANGITGLILAERAGLLTFKVAPVVKWLLGAISLVQEQSNNMDLDAEAHLNNYLSEHWNNVLRITSTQDYRSSVNGALDHLVVPDSVPKGSLMVRYEYDVKTMYFVTKPLREWCTKQQINYQGFVESLKKGRTKAHMDKKRLSKGTHMNLPATNVLVIDCSEFLDESTEAELAVPNQTIFEGDQDVNAAGASMS